MFSLPSLCFSVNKLHTTNKQTHKRNYKRLDHVLRLQSQT